MLNTQSVMTKLTRIIDNIFGLISLSGSRSQAAKCLQQHSQPLINMLYIDIVYCKKEFQNTSLAIDLENREFSRSFTMHRKKASSTGLTLVDDETEMSPVP